jgi:hypothetical protein
MPRRFLGTALLLGWLAATLGCGDSRMENKPNLTPQTPPPRTSDGGPGTSTASDKG